MLLVPIVVVVVVDDVVVDGFGGGCKVCLSCPHRFPWCICTTKGTRSGMTDSMMPCTNAPTASQSSSWTSVPGGGREGKGRRRREVWRREEGGGMRRMRGRQRD